LPEVHKRRLYEKKGYGSIFEFAAKLAGMSQEHVRRVLNLERTFEDKPSLHSLLINGKVSANKLVRIASIATPENQKELAQITETLSNRAIEAFVKDEKRALNEREEKPGSEICNIFELIDEKSKNESAYSEKCVGHNGLQKPLLGNKSVHVHLSTTPESHQTPVPILQYIKILESLSEETKNELLNLVEKASTLKNSLLKC